MTNFENVKCVACMYGIATNACLIIACSGDISDIAKDEVLKSFRKRGIVTESDYNLIQWCRRGGKKKD